VRAKWQTVDARAAVVLAVTVAGPVRRSSASSEPDAPAAVVTL
jgi:hypothetical protein